MQRRLQSELLDSLPHDHPDALHSRRDLRLTNRAMGNHRWFCRLLPGLLRPGDKTLEIGAGMGELGRRLLRQGVVVDGLDRCPRPTDWPEEQRWHEADLRTFDAYPAYAAVIGNLIFHQFSNTELATLGEKLRGTARVILASEPVRRRVSQILYRVFGPMLGANHVSLHDAHVSIAAGFRGDELPRALGLDRTEWDVRCTTTALGAYRMIAIKRT